VAQNVVRSVGHRKKRREAERRQKHKLKVAWTSPPPPRSRPLSANWKVAGGPLMKSSIIRTSSCSGWRPVQVAAGVVTKAGKAKYTGMHALRHFYASWCINRREDGGGDDGAELAAAESCC
jgi:hypothetical protein